MLFVSLSLFYLYKSHIGLGIAGFYFVKVGLMSPEEYISLSINILDSFGVTNAIVAVLAVGIAFAFVNKAFGKN